MNVLFVIHYPIFGGPHNQALNLAPTLAAEGVRLITLLPEQQDHEPGTAVVRLRDAGLEVTTIPLDRVRASRDPRRQLTFLANLPRDVRNLRHVIREREIDVVQIGGLVNPQGAVAARLERVPVIWQLLDTRLPMTVRRALMPAVLRLSDVIMTTGHSVAEVHPGAEAAGDRLRVFFPPVDPGVFDPDAVDRLAARRQWGFEPDDLVVGTVGNLNPQKGHEHLLRAAAMARRTLLGVRVLIAGASHDTHRGYELMLHNLARNLGMEIGRDVVFTGGLNDVRPALAALDLFALSSVPLSEGAPTAIEEAMMMGLPVVATDVGSVRELVSDDATGIVVRPTDAEALAEAIVWMLSDPALLASFGARGREVAIRRFSATECARIHVEAYRHALSRRRPG